MGGDRRPAACSFWFANLGGAASLGRTGARLAPAENSQQFHLFQPLVAGAALLWVNRGAVRLRLSVPDRALHLIIGAPTLTEPQIMLMVLALIDVVMIAKLLIMVIVGGYETFVSRLNLEGHPEPAGMALTRQCRGAQGEARHRLDRHLVASFAANLLLKPIA